MSFKRGDIVQSLGAPAIDAPGYFLPHGLIYTIDDVGSHCSEGLVQVQYKGRLVSDTGRGCAVTFKADYFKHVEPPRRVLVKGAGSEGDRYVTDSLGNKHPMQKQVHAGDRVVLKYVPETDYKKNPCREIAIKSSTLRAHEFNMVFRYKPLKKGCKRHATPMPAQAFTRWPGVRELSAPAIILNELK